MTVVLTVGSFTLLHLDHFRLFETCRRIAGDDGEVIVGVNGDEMIREEKGFRPEINQDDRIEMIRGIRFVDEVFLNEYADFSEHIINYQPNFIVVGSDWYGRDYLERIGVDFGYLGSIGCPLVFHASTQSYHSSELRGKTIHLEVGSVTLPDYPEPEDHSGEGCDK